MRRGTPPRSGSGPFGGTGGGVATTAWSRLSRTTVSYSSLRTPALPARRTGRRKAKADL
jgi:hypothetical protein